MRIVTSTQAEQGSDTVHADPYRIAPSQEAEGRANTWLNQGALDCTAMVIPIGNLYLDIAPAILGVSSGRMVAACGMEAPRTNALRLGVAG